MDDPAVILTDLHLGQGGDGLQLANAVRGQCRRIGVVLMTGDVEFREAGLPPGYVFLRKPFGMTQLLEAVSRASLAALHVEPEDAGLGREELGSPAYVPEPSPCAWG